MVHCTTIQLDPVKILLKYSFQSNLIQIPNKEILVTVLQESWNQPRTTARQLINNYMADKTE